MGTQQQDNSPGSASKQQQGGGQQGTPRAPGEIGKGDQDAGTIASPSKQQEDRKESGGRGKSDA
jgi:hypothetical protein